MVYRKSELADNLFDPVKIVGYPAVNPWTPPTGENVSYDPSF